MKVLKGMKNVTYYAARVVVVNVSGIKERSTVRAIALVSIRMMCSQRYGWEGREVYSKVWKSVTRVRTCRVA